MAVKSADQITIVDITDAYTVALTSEAYTFIGGTTYANAGSCTTQVIAYQGSDSVLVTVGTCTCPSGVTASVTNNGTASPTITFTVAANTVKSACEVTIPLTVNGDVEFTKKFSIGVALKGATGAKGDKGDKGETGAAGKGVASVSVTYQGGSSSTTPPTGTWQSSPPTVSAGQYLWTRFIFNYTDGTTSSPTYSVAKQGATGATGTAGSVWYTGTGITGTSTTATVFSGSGVSSANVNDQYLNTSTGYTYKCTVAGAASAAKWVYTGSIKGATGATGAPAITMSITSSAGTIFKNASIATTLTAHVYRAGVELSSSTNPTLASVGTIKWYKDGGTTAVGTGQTLTISAGDVDNKAVYVAQLE